MYQRILKPLKTRSFFLFGPRGVGKSTLLRQCFDKSEARLWLDLLDEDLNRRLLLHPKELEAQAANLKKGDWVIIDEVQKVPGLLNYVQRLIESKGLKFALTGSSARKLKRASVNLLGGRAHAYNLMTLNIDELGQDFNLSKALEVGLLPTIWQDEVRDSQNDYLRGYVNNYIRQEIKEEQAVRRLEPFLYFLEIAAQMNTEPINFTKIARDTGVDNKAIERYYEILVDTWLGLFLPPFNRSIRKQQLQRSKFYFFDNGVCRALTQTLNVQLKPSTSDYGKAFESFIVLEIHKLNAYYKKDFQLSYIRTKDDLEIDIVAVTPTKKIHLIEIKSTTSFDTKSISPAIQLKKDLKAESLLVFSQDIVRRDYDDFTVLPWRDGLAELQKLK